ncbi:hypothetical protein AN958_09324 [Leucoagaricus sp. SymC.cos]|nr:hypothetical protein AN958_09324 [Leucoagaricus sp. SymC.cos]
MDSTMTPWNDANGSVTKIEGVFEENLLFVYDPKALYHILVKLRQALYNQVKDGPKEVDILEWTIRTALELIGQSRMGYSFNSLEDEHVHPYNRSVKHFSGLPTGLGAFVCWVVEHTPSKCVQDMKDIADIMGKYALDTCKSKQEGILAGGSGKEDIVSILVRANASTAPEDKLTDAEVVAQIM